MMRLALALLLAVQAVAAQAQVGCPGYALARPAATGLSTGRVGQTLFLGLYPYNAGDTGFGHLAAFEGWLGAPADIVLQFLTQGSWSAMDSSAAGLLPLAPGRMYAVGFPLTVGSGTSASTTLAQVATGSNDADFTASARSLCAAQSTGTIIVRLGWEMNGPFDPWYAFGNEANYKAAFSHVVPVIRAACSRVLIDWNPNRTAYNASTPIDPTTMYPGDGVVDIIGQDVYFDVAYDGTASAAWSSAYTGESYGLNFLATFAAAHGKPMSVPEWGLNSDSYAPIVLSMAAWMQSAPVLWGAYWDSTQGFNGQLSSGQFSTSAANFIAAFGAPGLTSAATASVNVGSAATVALATAHAATLALTACAADPDGALVQGSALYIPAQGSAGTASVGVTARDARAISAAQTIVITAH